MVKNGRIFLIALFLVPLLAGTFFAFSDCCESGFSVETGISHNENEANRHPPGQCPSSSDCYPGCGLINLSIVAEYFGISYQPSVSNVIANYGYTFFYSSIFLSTPQKPPMV